MAKKVPCHIGGWVIDAVPGAAYTFGCGSNCWGPIPLEEVLEGMDVEGVATAIPVKMSESISDSLKAELSSAFTGRIGQYHREVLEAIEAERINWETWKVSVTVSHWLTNDFDGADDGLSRQRVSVEMTDAKAVGLFARAYEKDRLR